MAPVLIIFMPMRTYIRQFFQSRWSKLFLTFICFGLAGLLTNSGGDQSDNTSNPLAGHIAGFQSTLHKRELRLEQELHALKQLVNNAPFDTVFRKRPEYYNTLSHDEGLVLLVYENDTLKFWSDNSVAVENYFKEVCLDERMARLKNGWFEVKRKACADGRVCIGLLLIKYAYPYQNQYLQNRFHASFSLPEEADIITSTPDATNSITDNAGDYLFTLIARSSSSITAMDWLGGLALLLNSIGLLLLLFFIRGQVETFDRSIGRFGSTLLYIVIVILLRAWMIVARFPTLLDELPLFRPLHYGDARSFWLPSLGDFLINSLLLFFLVLYAMRRLKPGKQFSQANAQRKIGIALLFLCIVGAGGMLINELISGLVHNSDISFNLNDIFSLTRFSYIALLIIALLLASFFVLMDRFVLILQVMHLTKMQLFGLFICIGSIYVFVNHIIGTVDLIVVLWPYILFALILISRNSKEAQPYSFAIIIVLLSAFSFYTTHMLLRQSIHKEHDGRKLLAEQLAQEQDPVAEQLFSELEPRLTYDTNLIALAQVPNPDWNDFERYIRQDYFSGYWDNRYNIKITFYDTMCTPKLQAESIWSESLTNYEEEIRKNGTPTFSKNFYVLNTSSGRTCYLGHLVLQRPGEKRPLGQGILFIELESKLMVEEIGFPELLLDRELGVNQKLINYSYAKYRFNDLLNHSGKFAYKLHPEHFLNAADFEFIVEKDWDHLVHKTPNHTLVVLSKETNDWLGAVTSFSYLFTLFSLLLILVLGLVQLFTVGFTFSNITFKSRIQLVLILIVLISLSLFGIGSIYVIRQQYQAKNEEIISEKAHSVRHDLELKLKKTDLSLNLAYATYLLAEAANVFGTDVNLYNLQGNLYASSRQKLFDEGLVSRKMNPEAYLQIGINGSLEFIHDENIGNLAYLSAYLPVRNRDGQLEAYVNFPYFAKQRTLEKEISKFLVALINIYVLLFALSVLAAIFISNYLTNPLRLIQQKMRQVKLGRTNDPITWANRDEIGSLVIEYNRMINELALSAEKLAQSERESAWREMAKQVAHEIKNPLTPMRLSIQLFERAYKDKAPDIDQKLERMSRTLIEQIDTLSSIAGAFSDFAKMPRPINERMDILELARNAVEFFRESSGEIDFIFETGNLEAAFICADREQLVRVFNNLLKNAVQAIPENQQGRISVRIEKQIDDGDPRVLISITDNGTGIAPEMIDKIFMPNFTTKTAGMGLGLAMVKNIVENCDGMIRFETKNGLGTTFLLSFPEMPESGIKDEGFSR